jgi:predicted enzyme related to lactoylglutathione lyase
MKKRVTGVGGVFFKSPDPDALKAWYSKHLYIDSGEHGALFKWKHEEAPDKSGYTAWSVFPEDTTYFNPAKRDFMFNYIVENLEELLKVLQEEGVQLVGEMEEYPYGKFGWIMDPDGNKIELWEPLDENAL